MKKLQIIWLSSMLLVMLLSNACNEEDDTGSQFRDQHLNGNVENKNWTLKGGNASALEDSKWSIDLYESSSTLDTSNVCQEPEQRGHAVISFDVPETVSSNIETTLSLNYYDLFDDEWLGFSSFFINGQPGRGIEVTAISYDDITNYPISISGTIDFKSDDIELNGIFLAYTCIAPIKVEFAATEHTVNENSGEHTIVIQFFETAPEDGIIPISIWSTIPNGGLNAYTVDFTTSPEATTFIPDYYLSSYDDAYLALPVAKGDEGASFKVILVDDDELNGDGKIYFELLEASKFEDKSFSLGGVTIADENELYTLTVIDDE